MPCALHYESCRENVGRGVKLATFEYLERLYLRWV